MPFRCDSPSRRRWFHMTITPGADDTVRFRSVCMFEQVRSTAVLLLDRHAERDQTAATILSCGWCGQGHDGTRWLDLEDLVREQRLLERIRVPPIIHGICPACRAAMRATLNTAGDAREDLTPRRRPLLTGDDRRPPPRHPHGPGRRRHHGSRSTTSRSAAHSPEATLRAVHQGRDPSGVEAGRLGDQAGSVGELSPGRHHGEPVTHLGQQGPRVPRQVAVDGLRIDGEPLAGCVGGGRARRVSEDVARVEVAVDEAAAIRSRGKRAEQVDDVETEADIDRVRREREDPGDPFLGDGGELLPPRPPGPGTARRVAPGPTPCAAGPPPRRPGAARSAARRRGGSSRARDGAGGAPDPPHPRRSVRRHPSPPRRGALRPPRVPRGAGTRASRQPPPPLRRWPERSRPPCPNRRAHLWRDPSELRHAPRAR